MSEDNLFSPKLLLKDDSDPSIIARPLHIKDYSKGYCEILNQLSEVGQITEAGFIQRFRDYQKAKDVYYVVVLEDVGKKKNYWCCNFSS